MNNNFISKIKNLLISKNEEPACDAEQYIAAASLIKLHLSDESLDIIAGRYGTTRQKLLSKLDSKYFSCSGEGSFPVAVFGVDGNMILSRYFCGNPREAEEKIAELAVKNLLAEKDMILFEEKATSIKLLKYNSAYDCGISRINIFNLLRDCDVIESTLNKQNKPYALELSKLYVDCILTDNSLTSEELAERIEKSYIRVCETFTENTPKNLRIKVWHKYVNVCAELNMEKLPEELLEVSDFYKETSNFFKYRLSAREHSEELCRYAIQVSEKILNEIDEQDIPSLLLLGKIYSKNGDFENAKHYYLKASSHFNGMTAVIDLYESEICRYLSGTYDWKTVYALTCETERLYDKFLTETKRKLEEADGPDAVNKLQDNYIILITEYGRFKRNRKQYDLCFEVLENALNQYKDSVSIYRVYNELGLLYQTPGKQGWPNPYHNNEKAIEMLTAADEAARKTSECRKNPNIRKYMLMPLANTYYLNQNYEEALNVCSEILSIDVNEKRARNLMNKIMARMAA